MNPHRLHQALATALLLAAASMAGAQTGSSDGSTSANAPTTVTTPGGTPAARAAPSGPRHTEATTASRPASARETETPYHAALKRCVEGSADQRESCIDQAISQYGRS